MAARQRGSTGCLGCAVWIVGFSLAVGLLMGGWQWLNERGMDDITMRGTITVDASCDLPRAVAINGRSLTLDDGTPTPNGCEYTFVTSVKDRETYRVKVSGHDAVTFRRSMIDTIGPNGDTELVIRLSW